MMIVFLDYNSLSLLEFNELLITGSIRRRSSFVDSYIKDDAYVITVQKVSIGLLNNIIIIISIIIASIVTVMISIHSFLFVSATVCEQS